MSILSFFNTMLDFKFTEIKESKLYKSVIILKYTWWCLFNEKYFRDSIFESDAYYYLHLSYNVI
jgi:hypothetical protein